MRTSALRGLLTVVVVFNGLSVIASAQSSGQGGGPASESPFRLIRTVSGTKSEIRNGRFIILDPRASFRLPEDGKIIVYFEWLGPPGKHELVGTWSGPSKTSTTNSFEYVARENSFSAYWELTLTPTAPRGQWTLQASIDGFPAGVHAFEVFGPDGAAPVVSSPRIPLTRPEIFAKVLESSVVVESLDTTANRFAVAPGFFVEPNVVITAFSAVENAARLQVKTPKGQFQTDRLVGWNRRQGWALVEVDVSPGVGPVRAVAPARPGEACYSLAASPEGNLTVASGEVVGVGASTATRINVAFGMNGASPGAPVLNEYGELIGLMVEPLVEQALSSQQAMRLGQVGEIPVPAALPVAALPAPPWPAATSLATMAERGLFMPPVTLARQVLSGGFASKVPPRGQATMPEGQRLEFLTSDKTMVVFVTWAPSERIKGVCNLRFYDLDSRALGEAKPFKISVSKNQISMSVWSLPVPAAGIYRADVVLDGAVAWRGQFQVKE